MVIYRADPSETETIELELTRKAGKNLGIGFCTGNPKGIFVSDIVSIQNKLIMFFYFQ